MLIKYVLESTLCCYKLINVLNSYENCDFTLDVDLEENVNVYRFEINYEIDLSFINKLLERGQDQLILVVQSKDNKFFYINSGEKIKEIPKSRISQVK